MISLSKVALAILIGSSIGYSAASALKLDDLEAAHKVALAKIAELENQTQTLYTYALDEAYVPQNGKIDRSLRFDKAHWDKTITLWYAPGNSSVDILKLHSTICAVMERVDFVPNDYNIAQLVLETIQVESYRTHVRQLGGGPALGLIQMEPSTYEDLMSFVRRYKSVNSQVMSFYDKKSSLEDNLKHNVPFQIALVLANYWRKCGNLLSSFVGSTDSRWTLYKLQYNSTLGATDRDRYMTAARHVAPAQPTPAEFM